MWSSIPQWKSLQKGRSSLMGWCPFPIMGKMGNKPTFWQCVFFFLDFSNNVHFETYLHPSASGPLVHRKKHTLWSGFKQPVRTPLLESNTTSRFCQQSLLVQESHELVLLVGGRLPVIQAQNDLAREPTVVNSLNGPEFWRRIRWYHSFLVILGVVHDLDFTH